jgi:hypothetical protein
MQQIAGTYEGEGPNGSGTAASPPAAVAVVPDVYSSKDSTTSGQSRTASVALTRRRQLRVSSESARADTLINYGSADQILPYAARGIYITTAGTLVLRLAESTADQTYSGLVVGTVYPFGAIIIRNSGSTAAGIILY